MMAEALINYRSQNLTPEGEKCSDRYTFFQILGRAAKLSRDENSATWTERAAPGVVPKHQ